MNKNIHSSLSIDDTKTKTIHHGMARAGIQGGGEDFNLKAPSKFLN